MPQDPGTPTRGHPDTSSALDPYQRVLQKTFDHRIPFTAHWELTYRCNLSCLHCYATNRTGGKELTTNEVRNGLDQLARMGCLFLALTGGEVFCRSDLLEILTYAKQRSFALYLFTNGTMLTPDAADAIAAIEPVSVDISLYAVTPEIHDRITTVRGSHEKTVKALRLCRNKGLNVTIKSPLLRYNIDEFERLRSFANDIGARFVFDFLLVPADDGSRPMQEHGLSEQELRRFIAANVQHPEVAPEAPHESAYLCGAGSNAICITPTGDVLPCLAIREPVGNLRQQRLAEIWKSPLLDKLRNSRYRSLVDCRGCEDASYCSRCAGVAHAECGNILGRQDSACVVARATKEAVEARRP